MDKLKRFIDCYIETETCNLRCHYCYITLQKKFNNNLIKFKHSPKEIRRALSVQRLGGTCLLNLCAGGETLLAEEVLNVIKELLAEGHYVMVVTNGTLTQRFDEISKFPRELLKRLFFKFSFHYLELQRTGKMDAFFENINKMKNAGCSFTVEITPCDELIPHIAYIENICMEKLGAKCHVTIARDDRTAGIEVLTNHSFEQYKNIWSVFDSELFNFKAKIFHKKRKEFCYAGDWSLYLNLNSGKLIQCYCGRYLDNIYKNIDKPLKFEAIGRRCSLPHCYNGHAFLTLGTIPELQTPTYAEVRDRITIEGESWLQPEMRIYMSQKLFDNNEVYSEAKKRLIACKNIYYKVMKLKDRVLRKVKIKRNDKGEEAK